MLIIVEPALTPTILTLLGDTFKNVAMVFVSEADLPYEKKSA